MQEGSQIKLGIVGLGDVANRVHLPLWAEMNRDVKISALCDVDQTRLQYASKKFNVKNVYRTVDELLDRESLNLIDICAPPAAHKDLCLKVLRKGINCIVEKPLATSISDAQQIVKVAEENGVNLFIIHNYSFVPIIRKVRELNKAGEIGEILQVDVKFSIPITGEYDESTIWAHKLPGGLFGELAPHPCHILVELLGSPVKNTTALKLKRSSYPFIQADELKIQVSTEKSLGSLSVSFNSPTRRMTIDIIGSKLWVFVDAEAQVLVKYPPIRQNIAIYQRGQRALSDVSQRLNCLSSVSFGVLTGKYKPVVEGHRYLFKQAILTLKGQGSYPVLPKDVLEEITILQNAFKVFEQSPQLTAEIQHR